MFEFICEVVIDDSQEEIKTYAENVYECIDNLACMPSVNHVMTITRVEPEHKWSFAGDIQKLRGIRNKITDQELVQQLLQGLNIGD